MLLGQDTRRETHLGTDNAAIEGLDRSGTHSASERSPPMGAEGSIAPDWSALRRSWRERSASSRVGLAVSHRVVGFEVVAGVHQ